MKIKVFISIFFISSIAFAQIAALTSDQKKKLDEIHASLKPQMEAAHKEFRESMKEFRTAFVKGTDDEMKAAHEKLESSHRVFEEVHLQSMLQARTVLTKPEEREGYMKRMARMMHQDHNTGAAQDE